MPREVQQLDAFLFIHADGLDIELAQAEDDNAVELEAPQVCLVVMTIICYSTTTTISDAN